MLPILLACLVIFPLYAEDVADIVHAYAEHNASRPSRTKNYTYQMRSERRVYDRNGKLKSRDVKTLEYIYQSHGLAVRVVGRNDKPLSPREAIKEQQEIERSVANARPPSGRPFVERYRFQLDGVEQWKGRPTWVISSQPRTGDIQNRMKLWIDQADYECVRFEGDLMVDLNARFQHAKSNDNFTTELMRVDEGVWLPAHTLVRHYTRVPPFQRLDHEELEITYTNYKKFQTETRITDEAPGDW